jgi:tripartite-type tricarboxylate transporter receptor subunit TctC
MKKRYRNIALGLAAVAASLVSSLGAAQNFPVKPIRYLLPQAPGGVADITARLVAQKMSENLGQQVIIDNRPSAGAILAGQAVLSSPPDGYTMFLTGSGTAASVSLMKSLPYNLLRDFTQVATMGFFDLVFVTGPNSKLNTVADVIAFAKANPNKLSIGSINIGSTQNLAALMFKSMSGVNGEVVPYKATPAMVSSVISGDIAVGFEILAPVLTQIKSGQLKAIAMTSSERFAGLPNVPTIAESGVPGYQASSWNGASVPTKTPKAVIQRLNKAFAYGVNSPDVKQKLQDLGITPRALSPEDTRKLMITYVDKWHKVIEDAHIPKQ